MLDARDHHIREQWVKAMEARIVREELQKCHRAEGVNQQENCKWLAEKYLEKLEGSRVRGRGSFWDRWQNQRACLTYRLRATRPSRHSDTAYRSLFPGLLLRPSLNLGVIA